jgi:hypothetical protein
MRVPQVGQEASLRGRLPRRRLVSEGGYLEGMELIYQGPKDLSSPVMRGSEGILI